MLLRILGRSVQGQARHVEHGRVRDLWPGGALERELALGLVLPDLEAYRLLVRALYGQSFVAQSEITYNPPLLNGTLEITRGLRAARGALDKFDVYVEFGLKNREVRVQLAHAFHQAYLQRHPRSDSRDVFLASGQVLQVRFALVQPCATPYFDDLLFAVCEWPHDARVVETIRQGRGIDVQHLTGELRLFLLNVANPRHRKRPAVAALLQGALADPIIAELVSSGAIPGYFVHHLRPLVEAVHGQVVWLEAEQRTATSR